MGRGLHGLPERLRRTHNIRIQPLEADRVNSQIQHPLSMIFPSLTPKPDFETFGFPLNDLDKKAFSRARTSFVFSTSGTKAPEWSTLSIVLNLHEKTPLIVHLVISASLAELSWQAPNIETGEIMRSRAKEHYLVGRKKLETLAAVVDKYGGRDTVPYHLQVVASFWLLSLQWRRDKALYQELSRWMALFFIEHNLVCLLAALEHGRVDPQLACTARVCTWLFWTDAEACFQGHGGEFARHLTSVPGAIHQIYNRAKPTLSANIRNYPFDMVIDDNANERALELLHHTWVLVQELNGLDSEISQHDKFADLGMRMENFLQETFSNVVSMANSGTIPRDRQLGNADWAVANAYAFCIYLSRCAEEHDVLLPPSITTIPANPAGLFNIFHRSLHSGGPVHQHDRLQWAIFWGGIQTRDGIHQDWAKEKLEWTSLSLRKVMGIVQEEQLRTGANIRIGKLRKLCQGGGYNEHRSSIFENPTTPGQLLDDLFTFPLSPIFNTTVEDDLSLSLQN